MVLWRKSGNCISLEVNCKTEMWTQNRFQYGPLIGAKSIRIPKTIFTSRHGSTGSLINELWTYWVSSESPLLGILISLNVKWH